MVKYYGRARQRIGSVNTNQLGLKMSGCPSKVGRSGRIARYISRRSHCGIVFCGWVWYHGIKWKYNNWVNPYTKEINWRCVPAAPITRSLAGGVGRLNAPRFRCAKDCGRHPWWNWTNNPHSSPRALGGGGSCDGMCADGKTPGAGPGCPCSTRYPGLHGRNLCCAGIGGPPICQQIKTDGWGVCPGSPPSPVDCPWVPGDMGLCGTCVYNSATVTRTFTLNKNYTLRTSLTIPSNPPASGSCQEGYGCDNQLIVAADLTLAIPGGGGYNVAVLTVGDPPCTPNPECNNNAYCIVADGGSITVENQAQLIVTSNNSLTIADGGVIYNNGGGTIILGPTPRSGMSINTSIVVGGGGPGLGGGTGGGPPCPPAVAATYAAPGCKCSARAISDNTWEASVQCYSARSQSKVFLTGTPGTCDLEGNGPVDPSGQKWGTCPVHGKGVSGLQNAGTIMIYSGWFTNNGLVTNYAYTDEYDGTRYAGTIICGNWPKKDVPPAYTGWMSRFYNNGYLYNFSDYVPATTVPPSLLPSIKNTVYSQLINNGLIVNGGATINNVGGTIQNNGKGKITNTWLIQNETDYAATKGTGPGGTEPGQIINDGILTSTTSYMLGDADTDDPASFKCFTGDGGMGQIINGKVDPVSGGSDDTITNNGYIIITGPIKRNGQVVQLQNYGKITNSAKGNIWLEGGRDRDGSGHGDQFVNGFDPVDSLGVMCNNQGTISCSPSQIPCTTGTLGCVKVGPADSWKGNPVQGPCCE